MIEVHLKPWYELIKRVPHRNDFVDVGNIIMKLKENAKDFEHQISLINLTIFSRRDNFDKLIQNLIKARFILDDSRFILMSLIEPERNPHIKQYIEQYKILHENLGRMEKNKIDKQIDDLLNSKNSLYPSAVDVKVSLFANTLISIMEGLILYPLDKALDKFFVYKEKGDIITDVDYYIYLVFMQLFSNSLTMGIWSRYEDKRFENIQTPPEVPRTIIQKESQEIVFRKEDEPLQHAINRTREPD